MRFSMIPAFGVLTLVSLPMTGGPAARGDEYSVTGLQLPGYYGGALTALSDKGQVAGYSWGKRSGNEGTFATVSNYEGKWLGSFGTALGRGASYAYGINAAGQVTGEHVAADGTTHAFLSGVYGWKFKDLGGIGRFDNSEGMAVNASGQVAGIAFVDWGVQHAFLSGPNGGALRDIGTLGGADITVTGVNASGQVTGTSSTIDSSAGHAFLSAPNGGPLRDLGTLGGISSTARGVNDAGQVVGSYQLADGRVRAFVSAPGGGSLQDLGEFAGDGSRATSINNSGHIVGNYPGGAFLYAALTTLPSLNANSYPNTHAYGSAVAGMINLNTLIDPSSGIYLGGASAISDDGHILAIGYSKHDQFSYYLLTPDFAPASVVPTPSGLVLLGTGLAGLLGWGYRRRAEARV